MTDHIEEIIPESKKKSTTRRKVYQFLFTLCDINTEKTDVKYNLCNKVTDKTLLPVNTTRISDLSLDIKTPEIISFLDDSKKLHKCYVSMIDFQTREKVHFYFLLQGGG